MYAGGIKINHAMVAHYVWLAFGLFAILDHVLVAAWGAIVCANVWAAANYIVERK